MAESANPPSFELPADLSIRSAAALQARLREALTQASLRLNAAGVERVDAAGLQLFAAFCLARPAGSWEWDEVPELLGDAARTLNLTDCLALPSPASPPEKT